MHASRSVCQLPPFPPHPKLCRLRIIRPAVVPPVSCPRIQAWVGSTESEESAWAQGTIASALGLDFCWLHAEATSSCGAGAEAGRPYQMYVCD